MWQSVWVRHSPPPASIYLCATKILTSIIHFKLIHFLLNLNFLYIQMPPASSTDEAFLPHKEPESDHVGAESVTIIKFRGRIFDVDKWLREVSKCRYLPEDEMRTLCAM